MVMFRRSRSAMLQHELLDAGLHLLACLADTADAFIESNTPLRMTGTDLSEPALRCLPTVAT
jgi:hypothetical protein